MPRIDFQTSHPRLSLVVRLAATTLAWAFLVTANPAGATAPATQPPPGMVTKGARERSGLLSRAEGLKDRRARERERRIEALAEARAKAKRERARRKALRIEKAKERARFIATHRCPVDAPRRWLRGDWHPEPYARAVDGATEEKRGHFGIDLFAPAGTRVRAPFDGRLEYGRSPRGGLFFKLRGAGGYAYGSHMLARGAPPGRVKAADVIGYVGRSGNARGTHPHLHFEWHPGGGKAANPTWILWNRCGPPSRSYPS